MEDNKCWELPSLIVRRYMKIDNEGINFWSAKFYPYTAPGVDPVFAAIGEKRILIFRLNHSGEPELIRHVQDEEPDAENFSCAWTKLDGKPRLCVAGAVGKILILDVATGDLLRDLGGHGGPINELVVSPTNPQLLASASDDHTVRIWSLNPEHEKDPCVAILAGDGGHLDGVLTLDFHASGKYLVSAGKDCSIKLWAVPDFSNSSTETRKVVTIHNPHFSTSEIHSRHVDCVAFYNDLIFSKCEEENSIVLWAINGFNLNLHHRAPTTYDPAQLTRSAFVNKGRGYIRLLEFSNPSSEYMFIRFSMYQGSLTNNAVLAACNAKSKLSFWDLSRLEVYHEFKNQKKVRQNEADLGTESCDVQVATSDTEMKPPSFLTLRGSADWHRYSIGNPFKHILAHWSVAGSGARGAYVAWSNGGEWCVVVGSSGLIMVSGRWLPGAGSSVRTMH